MLHRLTAALLFASAIVSCESRRSAGDPPSTAPTAGDHGENPPPATEPDSDEPPPGWPADAGAADPEQPPVETPSPLPSTTPPNGIAE